MKKKRKLVLFEKLSSTCLGLHENIGTPIRIISRAKFLAQPRFKKIHTIEQIKIVKAVLNF